MWGESPFGVGLIVSAETAVSPRRLMWRAVGGALGLNNSQLQRMCRIVIDF